MSRRSAATRSSRPSEALLLNPDLARDALRVLAKLQASEDDPWRDAEPGKIMHELRVGELAGAGIVPAHALLRDGRRDAAVPDVRRGLLRLDGRPRDAARASSRARCGARLDRRVRRPRRRRVRRVRAPLARRPAQPGVEGLPRLGRARRRHASPRVRSRSSRCRAMCTAPSSRSPTSTPRSETTDVAAASARRGAAPARGVQRGVLESRGGNVRARARRAQAPGRERHLEPRPLPVLRDRRAAQAPPRWPSG